MKKFLKIFLSFSVAFLPWMALADPNILQMKVPNLSVTQVINNLLNWFFFILIAIAVFMILNVGYQYMISGGNSTKTSVASKNLGFVLIGVAIAILAKSLVYVTCHLISGDSSLCTFF